MNSLPSGMGITYFQLPPGLNSWRITCTFIPFGAHHCVICSGRVQASHTVATGTLKDRLIDKIRLLRSFGFSMVFIFPALQLVYIVLESIDPLFPQTLIPLSPIRDLFQFSRADRAKGFPPFPPGLDHLAFIQYFYLLGNSRTADLKMLSDRT